MFLLIKPSNKCKLNANTTLSNCNKIKNYIKLMFPGLLSFFFILLNRMFPAFRLKSRKYFKYTFVWVKIKTTFYNCGLKTETFNI